MEKIKKFFFVNTSINQTIIKNTFWLFVAEIGIRLLKLVIFIYAARKLGTSEWGIFSYALALMSLFSIISDIGINSVILRETARKNGNETQYISTSFFLKIGLSILCSSLFLLLIVFLKDTNPVKILIPLTALVLFLDSLREFGFAINRAFEKMEMEALAKIVATILLVATGFFFISREPKSISMIYAYLVSGIVGVFIMYISLRSHFKNLVQNFNKSLILTIFREAWPIAIVGILGNIMTNIDTIILGVFRDTSQIGLYSAAQKPVQIVYLIPSILSTAILPLFSRLAVSDKEQMKKIVKKFTNLSVISALIIAIGCITIGGYVFLFLFGKQYIEAIPVFKILSIAIITGAPSIIISNALFAMGKQKKILEFIAITLLLNIILCFILIPTLGIYGAAFSVTVAQVIGNVYLIIRAKKELRS